MTTREPGLDDGGSISVFVAVLAVSLVFVVALVADGTDRMRLQAHADAVAGEAARAALTAVDTRNTTIGLDPATATAAARQYLAATGHPGSIHVDPAGTVHVTVTHTEPAEIGLLTPTQTVTGHATAQLAVGTTDPGDRR